jgi:hypothetical protein
MKKIFFTLFIVLTTIFTCSSQEIELAKRKFFDLKGIFVQDGERLTMGQAIKKMDSNPKASGLMKTARVTRFLGLVIGGAGSNMIVAPIIDSIDSYDDKEPNWNSALIGAGLLALDIVLITSSNKKIKKSLEVYNEGLSASSYYKPKTEFEIIGNQNGIGLRIKF